jgi:hypothetical protein
MNEPRSKGIAVFYQNQETHRLDLGIERFQVNCHEFRTNLVEYIAAIDDINLPNLRREFSQ